MILHDGMVHPITQAFRDGCEAFKAGQEQTANPHGEITKPLRRVFQHNWDEPSKASLAYEWDRGYCITRKVARFNATIAARKTKA